jgi:hypothetical protein
MDADKLVAAYIKMRDAKEALTREYDLKVEAIKVQMDKVEEALLELCKSTGQDGGKTLHGTFTRTVKTRYTTTNWDAMRRFIKEHDAIDLLEQRISQLKMKQFLSENPGLLPEGLNVDARYAVVVRRKTS